ncbi:hypothetical protein CF70_033875 [Cupriavidus sp. SK-3]|uniref:hypothetical protein n=1 Tax=Cupriavidus sp. SK-3 TaxID=1470558 RepID=UPI00044737BA|nr:hypothetical protein [Cupriavidus sp. SK-3]KDP87890.1 hypothetical protein CF70_033875 [Cupriavidus sp. SK-3]
MDLTNARVEFQTDLTSFGEGVVIAHDSSNGRLVIRDDDGIHWRGDEDHIEVIYLPSERSAHAG